jgi:hypothetical protein
LNVKVFAWSLPSLSYTAWWVNNLQLMIINVQMGENWNDSVKKKSALKFQHQQVCQNVILSRRLSRNTQQTIIIFLKEHYWTRTSQMRSRYSILCTVTTLRGVRSGVRILTKTRNYSSPYKVRPGFMAHPAS